jgi:HEPN domain-containing protein
VTSVDSDLYILRVPRIFGSVEFIASREFLPKTGIGRGPAICNVLQLVESLSQTKARHLSDEAIHAIWNAFHRAFPALYMLENTPNSLMHLARGDVATAVEKLLNPADRFGESKWASLQAAEKCMKCAIALAGGKVKFTHDLTALSKQLHQAGIPLAADEAIDKIQCAADIRYGGVGCSRAEALAAHHASLDVINALKAAGAMFETGLG